MSGGLVATPDSSVWAVALDPPPTKVAPAPFAVTTLKATVVVRDRVAVSVSHVDGEGEGELRRPPWPTGRCPSWP